MRTQREVVLAADTKLRKVDDLKAKDAGSVHKIGKIDNLVFASAGLLGDSAGKFSLPKLVTIASEGNPSFADKVLRFENLARQPLIEMIRDIKGDHPTYFTSELDMKFVLQIAFGTFELGQPHLHTMGYKCVQGGESLEIVRDPFDGASWVALGENSAIREFVASNPYIDLFAGGWRQSIEKLIALEAHRHPDKVALPVDIAHISVGGMRWL